MSLRPLIALLLIFGSAAQAEPPPMAAAGALESGGRTSCSAVLIAPHLIATAAHCLPGNKSNSTSEPNPIVFRTGAYPGHLSRDFEVAESVVHPLFGSDQEDRSGGIRADVALARLAVPVPAEVARPIPPGMPIGDDDPSVLLATWPGGAGARARERRCPVLAAEGAIATLSCIVIPGESGGAVVRLTESGPELAAIVVATARSGRQPFGFAVQARSRIAQLKAIYGF
ncbi:MAG: trypsin-like serine protease [Pseudomonadota bacterium]